MWERFHAAEKVDMPLREHQELPSRSRFGETLRLALTVAMVVPHWWLAPPWTPAPLNISVPEVVRAMPLSVMIPNYRSLMAEDCRLQQAADRSVQCEDLVP